MAQQNNPSKSGQQDGGADHAAQSGLSGEAADNGGFQASPEESQRRDDPGAQENDPATGGPKDPTDAEQNPVGEDDTEQNPPLPRTWN